MNINEANSFGEQQHKDTPQAAAPAPADALTDVGMEPSAISSSDVTAALNAILAVDKFAASPQMSAFLKYVVEQTLLGNTRRIKAFTVGLEALGKSASFDPQTDPSVRVLAKRLRSSLDTYYMQHPDTPIIIDMKPGSYVPKFLVRGQTDLQQTGTVATIAVPATSTLNTPRPATTEAAPSHAAHVSINQPTKIGGDNSRSAQESSSVTPATADTSETRESGIQRLWKAYKSAPKVAVLVATMGISGWLGVASMTPALNAQASYQHDNSTAEMRLELAAASIEPPLRERPASLTLYTGVEKPAADSVDPTHAITAALIDRFSESDQFDIASETLPVKIGSYWPEEYQVIIESIPVNQKVRLYVQVVDPDNGYIAQAESIFLDQSPFGNEISSGSDDLLGELVNAFERADSPLQNDLNSKQNIVD